jgi:hypothetical protein
MPGARTLVIGLLISILVSGIWVAVFSLLPINSAKFDANTNGLLDVLIWIAAPMYLGIFCGQCFFAAREIKGAVTLGAILAAVRNSAAVYAAIFFSPILFFAILTASSANIISIQTIAFAFQNGFFIQSAMRLFIDRHDSGQGLVTSTTPSVPSDGASNG